MTEDLDIDSLTADDAHDDPPTAPLPLMLLEPPPLPPPNGWSPEDFPQLVFDLIPYSANPQLRADPYMTVNPEGWLYIQAGNGRVAVPDREEWNKLVFMVECLWNSYRLCQQPQSESGEESKESSAESESEQ